MFFFFSCIFSFVGLRLSSLHFKGDFRRSPVDAEAAFPLLLPGSLGKVHQRLWRGASGRVSPEGHFSCCACAGVAACPPLLLPLLRSQRGLVTSRARHPAHLVPVSFHSLPPLASG